MFPNTVSLNLSFTQKLKDDSSNSSNSLIFFKKGTVNNKQKQKTNIENKYFKNEQYIMTNLYNSIKQNMQKNREKKENTNKEDKKILSFQSIEKLIYKSFRKYYNNNSKFNIIKIDEIINNEKSHLVAEFKDFLVMGDMGEFILKYYNKKEIDAIYKQILDYYNENLFIFPNYVALYESKYIYNNIQKKQKIIDIQEELNDNKDQKNKNEKKEKQDPNKVFSVKEIDSILNETNTSGIRKYFGISDNSVTENGINKNEQQIFELIEKINVIEKNSINNNKENNNNNKNYKDNNKSLKQEDKKISIKGNISNGNNKRIIKEKENISNQKEKVIKGRNEKINIYGQDKTKNISEIKYFENKTLKNSNNLSQPNLYIKNQSNTKIIFMNSINEKNNSKENSKKVKEIIDKEIKKNDLAVQNKKKIIEKFYSKENNKNLLNKIMNKTKNFSLFQDNNEYNINGMNKSHPKIIINKTIIKEVVSNKNKNTQNLVYSKKSKNYKKELMNFLFSSKTGNNSKQLKFKENKNYNTSRIDNNFFTSTITDDKSTIMTNNQVLKNGQIYFNIKKDNLNIKNNLSNSCQNIIIKSYNSNKKKLNFNKTNYNLFSSRNISYKLITNNLTGNENNYTKKKDRNKNNCVIGSYSVKDIYKKTIRKSSESLKCIHRANAHSRKSYEIIKSKTIMGKTNILLNSNKGSSALTDRKNISEISNNLEKIDALSRNIRKIKENLKKNMESNKYNLSSLLFNHKTKPLISKKTKEKIIEQNKNAINIYLVNRTRNKSKKEIISNNVNFSTLKINTIKLSDTVKKDKENTIIKNKNNFKTINTSNSKQNLKINNPKNTFDLFKDYTIMNYNKK